LFDEDKDLIARCLNREVAAEYQIYRRFAAKMFGVCLRYCGNDAEAEEVLQSGFIRLFANLQQFRFDGTLDGWVLRIFITTAINHRRDNLRYSQVVELSDELEDSGGNDALSRLSVKELLTMIQQLPEGSRTVFNMYVIENYKHNEIAAILGISEGTSKSQLNQARATIRQMLKNTEKKRSL
jgi:RNA polymerase sigma-70 factor (ECF subfamily)